ncbi:MAG: ROK family protein [Eubacteriales bacterium]
MLSKAEIEWITALAAPVSGDRTNGMITFSSNLHFHQFPLGRLHPVKNFCKKSLSVENDAMAAAYGEFFGRCLKECNNAPAITLGTGCWMRHYYRRETNLQGFLKRFWRNGLWWLEWATASLACNGTAKRLLGAICITANGSSKPQEK